MIPYITITRNNNTIECSSDFVAIHNRRIITLSLVDVGVKVKKVFSDLIKGSDTVLVKDRADYFFQRKVTSYHSDKYSYNYKISKIDDKSVHGLLYSNNENYIYDWEGKGLIESLSLFLRQKKFLPITSDIVKKVLELADSDSLLGAESIVETCEIITNNDDMRHVNIWYFSNLRLFKELLEKIQ